ncbi:MAG: DUF1493 family protein [Alphaproteobacteria bacterium]|nr:DUF1493 family protein [Alphaproteobacteria bacterium]
MLEKVKRILEQYTEEEIYENTKLSADLGLSSLDIAMIVEDFEEAFDVEIPDRDISKFVCVSDILEYLKRLGK